MDKVQKASDSEWNEFVSTATRRGQGREADGLNMECVAWERCGAYLHAFHQQCWAWQVEGREHTLEFISLLNSS
jgi:hypothetical protein